MRRVALIVAKRDGLVLFGKRSDNGRWTLPGGHLEEGEDPRAGARRELLEETGLAPEGAMELIDERETEAGLKLYTYECTVAGAPTGKNDPDNECQLWAFLDVADGIPKAVAENMQGPKNPDDNVAADLMGLAKAVLDPGAGYKLSHEFWGENNGRMSVFAHDANGSEAGRADIDVNPDHLHVAGVLVEPEHRRKGLASAMFAHAEKHAGRPVSLENTVMTQSGKAFTQNRPWAMIKGEDPHPGRVYAALMRLKGRELAASCDEDELDPFTDEDETVLEAVGLMKDGQPVELKKMAPTRMNQLEIDNNEAPAPKPPKVQSDDPLEDFNLHDPAHIVKRVHNRFVGTKATEASSKLGSGRRSMAERQAFDYSHHLNADQRKAGYAITVYHHPTSTTLEGANTHPPLIELTHNGKLAGARTWGQGATADPNKTVFPGHDRSGLMNALHNAGYEHVENTRRTVKDGNTMTGLRNIPYLDSLPLPPVGERGQLLEIDKPKRGKKAPAAPAVDPSTLTSGLGQALDVAPDLDPSTLQLPQHVGEHAGGHVWDYTNWLSPEDQAAGRRIRMLHLPGDEIGPNAPPVLRDPYINGAVTSGTPQDPMPGVGDSLVEGHGDHKTISRFGTSSIHATHDQMNALRAAMEHHQRLTRLGLLKPPAAAETSRFAGLELSEKPFAKREHDDEIDRLLMHPNPSERSMALKIHGVQDKHLIRAFTDEDPAIQKQALRHGNLGHHGLLALMQMPNREHLQHLALEHPLVNRSHVEALYHTHKDRPVADKARVMHAISHSGHLDTPLIERMFKDGNGDAVVENLNTPAHVVEQIIEEHHLQPDDAKKRALARRALKHVHAPAHLVEHSFKNGPMDVKIAIAQSHHLPEALAQDVLQRGHLPAGDAEALLRTFIVQNQKASKRHLETASSDRNPIVAHEARRRLGRFQKFEKDLNTFLGQGIKKAVRQEDFKGIRSGLDPAGSDLVDHKPELEAHPPQHNADVAAYKHAILDSDKPVKRTAASANNSISRKVVYTVPATHPTHGNVRYMVKPYHERISRVLKGWQKHPHQGWAEMTNQALYHAAGIGHLHQNVHVVEHHMGEGNEAEPALVIKMDSDADPFRYHAKYRPEVKEDARKLAVMDFLSNNLDRHQGNVMFTNWKPIQETPTMNEPNNLLAVDHSRSFQYTNNYGYKRAPRRAQPRQLEDSFGSYMNETPLGAIAPLRNHQSYLGGGRSSHDPHQWVDDWTPAFDWWGDNSDKIKATMGKRLDQIKDPEVRKHIERNFNARANWLDERSKLGIDNYGDDWYKHPVEQYRPGEKTDEELEHERWKREYGEEA